MKLKYLSIVILLSSFFLFSSLEADKKYNESLFSQDEEARLEHMMNEFLNNPSDGKPFDDYVNELVDFLGRKEEFKKFCIELKRQCKTRKPKLIGLVLYKSKHLFPEKMKQELEKKGKNSLLELLEKRLGKRK